MQFGDYIINAVDTPGHSQFFHSVVQAVSAVDGILLLIDATQGVQAQTMAACEIAHERNLGIVPVINKCDFATTEQQLASIEQVEELLPGCIDPVMVSAKTGHGVFDALDAIVTHLPPASDYGNPENPLQARIFDSSFCSYRGIVVLCRLVNGRLAPGDEIRVLSSPKRRFTVTSVGYLCPHEIPALSLEAGDVGFFTAGMKNLLDAPVGATVAHTGPESTDEGLPGYKEATPVVWLGLFPTDPEEFPLLQRALQQLKLTDASVEFEVETSAAMGSGFRIGLSGLLHGQVVQSRLEDEFGLDLIATSPSVSYEVRRPGESEWVRVANPSRVPDGSVVIREPYAEVDILCRESDLGCMMRLMETRRSKIEDQRYIGGDRVRLRYIMPLADIVDDLLDTVKQQSSGYATMEFRTMEPREGGLVRMDFLIAGEKVEGLTMVCLTCSSCLCPFLNWFCASDKYILLLWWFQVVERDSAYRRATAVVSALKENIPRHMFKVSIQACIGSKVIAAEHINPVRKAVTAKCYGGDVSRKRKVGRWSPLLHRGIIHTWHRLVALTMLGGVPYYSPCSVPTCRLLFLLTFFSL